MFISYKYAGAIQNEWLNPPIMSILEIQIQVKVAIPKSGFKNFHATDMIDGEFRPHNMELFEYYCEMLLYTMNGIVFYDREQIKKCLLNTFTVRPLG